MVFLLDGLGKVNEDGYVDDESYQLITWDVVANPSNMPSWLNGIYEAKEYMLTESGIIIERDTKETKLLKEEVKQEAYKLWSPEFISYIAEDKQLTEAEARKAYINITKGLIDSILEKKLSENKNLKSYVLLGNSSKKYLDIDGEYVCDRIYDNTAIFPDIEEAKKAQKKYKQEKSTIIEWK